MKNFGNRDNKAISIDRQIERILDRTGEQNEKSGSRAWALLEFYLNEISYDTLFYKNEQFFFSDYPSNNREFKKGIKSREIIKIYDALNQLKLKIAENTFLLEEWFKSVLKVTIGQVLASRNELEFTIRNKFKEKNIVFHKDIKLSLSCFDDIVHDQFKKYETLYRFKKYGTLWQLIDSLTFNELCNFINENKKEVYLKEFFDKVNQRFLKKQSSEDDAINLIKYIGKIRNLVVHNNNIFGNSRLSKDLFLKPIEENREKIAFLSSSKFNEEEWYIAADMLEIIKIFSTECYLSFLGSLSTILSSLLVPDTSKLILNSIDLFGKEII